MTTAEPKKKNDNGLADMVKNIAQTIERGRYETDSEEDCNAYDYLSDALDFRWIVQNDLTFIGARILVAFGGPNVWIDTDKKKVEGYWWGDYASANYSQDPLGIQECVEELYQMRLDEAKRNKWSASPSTHETAHLSAVLWNAAKPKCGDDSTAFKNM